MLLIGVLITLSTLVAILTGRVVRGAAQVVPVRVSR